MTFKIAIIDDKTPDHAAERLVFKSLPTDIVSAPAVRTEAEISDACRGAHAILANLVPVTERVMDAAPECRVIVRYGVGYDGIETEAAARRGIAVANVPDYCTDEVAEHSIALLLAAERQIVFRDTRIRAGEWHPEGAGPMRTVKGSVLGIVGYGRIGRAVHQKSSGFGFSEILVYDPYVDPATIRHAGAIPASLERLAERADYVTLHCPLTDETRSLIDARILGLMKPDVVIVNTARGPVIETPALAEALEAGKVRWVALDVHDREPTPAGYPFRRSDRAILSDHIAWYSRESDVELRRRVAVAARRVLEGDYSGDIVNRDRMAELGTLPEAAR